MDQLLPDPPAGSLWRHTGMPVLARVQRCTDRPDGRWVTVTMAGRNGRGDDMTGTADFRLSSLYEHFLPQRRGWER